MQTILRGAEEMSERSMGWLGEVASRHHEFNEALLHRVKEVRFYLYFMIIPPKHASHTAKLSHAWRHDEKEASHTENFFYQVF